MKDFSKLADSLKKAPKVEIRKETDGYLELVIAVNDLPKIYPALDEFFGPPFKPAGVEPSKEAAHHSAKYGGIQQQQTLFYAEHKGLSTCAMLWPWQDKEHVTVKVAQGEILK